MHSLKYILSFFAGVSLTLLLMQLVDTQPEPLNWASDNLIDFEKAKADDTVVLKMGVVENMQQKIIELETKLEQLVPSHLSEASDANVHNYEASTVRSLAEYQASEKSLKQKLSNYSWENATLKQRLNELEPSSVSDEEIEAYKKTQAPKYRAIFDELMLQPQFSLSPAFYSPSRFSLYLLLKDTAALVAEQQPQNAS